LVARYTNPVVYGLLTLVVVVPLVFLAAPKGARQSPQAFSPMDAVQPATVARADSASPLASIAPDNSVPAQSANVAELPAVEPVMASIAPMPATAPATKSREAGARVLRLAVSEPTWVELTAADGRRLEYAQLPPGTTRDYVVDGGADLVVGNVPAVVATLNGEAVDLNAVANRNVARLRVGDDAATARQ
jgi:cytoskeleton protein RodZ